MGDNWEQAEARRKNGDWAGAGRFFHELWKDTGRPAAGWRYGFCLRKAGYAAAAQNVLERVLRTAPADAGARRELVWTLYYGKLAPALKEGDEMGVLDAARRMLELGADGPALQLALFGAVRAAKLKGHWHVVRDMCERIAPDQLSAEGVRINQRSIPSPRERWHVAYVKALLGLREWALAEAWAARAAETYPRQTDFKRWQARALAELGRLEEALDIDRSLAVQPRAAWYVLADVCEYEMRLGNMEAAWEAGIAALRLPADDKARVTLLLHLSEVALTRDQREAATNLLGWCLAMRQAEGWPRRAIHEDLMARLGSETCWDSPVKSWKEACRPLWSTPSAAATEPSASGVRTGRVTGWSEGRPFAFIRQDGESYFVLVRELPDDCRRNGAEVTFDLRDSFDRKKQKASQQAMNVRPVGSQKRVDVVSAAEGA